MELINQIKELSENFHKEIISIRRHIHQNPELSFNEFETSEFICSKLDEYNVSYKNEYVKTGIIATIKGKNPDKKIIALRADMDALPIIEENEIPYKSVNKTMHACGHDAHTASLLGTAKILNILKDKFEGTVKLIFQPGEELLPGGALLMLDEGTLKDSEPDIVIGQHVLPTMKSGKAGFRKGMYMASSDEIYLTVSGKGGHAAITDKVTDTVLIASQIIVALQQIVSRNAQASIPTVLSFGRVEANGATNVIPNKVKIDGTFRTMDEEWRKEAHLKIEKIAKSIAEGMGGKCEVKIVKGYPFLKNNELVTEQAKSFAEQYLGKENVEDMEIRMTAEDFAYFAQKYPSTFYRLGTAGNNKISHLHTSTFNIDENALCTGMGLMAWIAVSFLNK
ncbi:MAG: amidohydrolase [Bacteroidales bacterium]|nr:amidohydrolase [Bacteroidales bacterium]